LTDDETVAAEAAYVATSGDEQNESLAVLADDAR
jgi:hypothetical protein